MGERLRSASCERFQRSSFHYFCGYRCFCFCSYLCLFFSSEREMYRHLLGLDASPSPIEQPPALSASFPISPALIPSSPSSAPPGLHLACIPAACTQSRPSTDEREGFVFIKHTKNRVKTEKKRAKGDWILYRQTRDETDILRMKPAFCVVIVVRPLSLLSAVSGSLRSQLHQKQKDWPNDTEVCNHTHLSPSKWNRSHCCWSF